MHWQTPALVAGALALQASALLIPLEVSQAAEQAKSELASLLVVTTGVNVDLDCPGCPFLEADEPAEFGVENKIHLEFEVDPERGLTINGFPIFPSDAAATNAGAPSVVTAPQIRVEDGEQTDPVQLDFAWERLPPVTSRDEQSGAIVLPLRFTILGLHGYPVKVDTIAIDLLQTPQETSIARFDIIPFEDTPGAATCDLAAKWSLCRLRAIIAARLQSIMEAAKTRAHAAKGWMKSGQKGGCHGRKFGAAGRTPHAHHGGPHMGGGGGRPHHHHHHGGHRAHHLGHMLHQTLRFFVIPALLGVIGGLMASAVGMLVGQLICFLWVRFHRNGRRGDASVRVVEVVVVDEEKDPLMDDADLPPPPQYQDVQAELEGDMVVGDEKH